MSHLKKPKEYYSIDRKDVLEMIPADSNNILDIGCGEGRLGRDLEQRGAKNLVGVERCPKAAKKAKKVFNRVLVGDIETMRFPFKRNYFDCIICADVLEHLIDPVSLLVKLKDHLKKEGCLIASIPNVQHYTVSFRLLWGQWDYRSSGILDETHLRFFTLKTIKDLFFRSGFLIVKIKRNYLVSKWAKVLTLNLIRLFKGFSTYQYRIVAKKR
ncbi:MAG: class I SAM-dependent methyltransferase [Spirochaetes bacterium]|nr:class I SAM-dependent methyltransferase [Spirochaetota bacterium]